MSVTAVAQLGNRGADLASVIAPGADGSVVIGTHFKGTLSGQGAAMTARGGGDVAFVGFDRELSPRWSRHFGGTGLDEVRALVPFGDGFAAAGFFAGDAGFGDNERKVPNVTSQGGSDGFVAYIDARGAPVELQRVGGKQADHVRSIVALDDGGLLVGGHFQAASRLAPGSAGVVIGAGGTDVFVQRLDAGRRVLWARTFGGIGDDELSALAQLPGGGTLLLLRHDRPIELRVADEARTITPRAGHDALLLWLGHDGRVVRAVSIASSGSDELHHVAALDADTIVLAGEFQGDQRWSFDSVSSGQSLRSRGSTDVVVLYLDGNGRPRAQQQFGSAGPDTADTLAVSGGDAWLAVGWQGRMSLSGRNAVESADTSALLLRLGQDGSASDWLAFEGEGVQKITALAAQPRHVWVTGIFEGSLAARGVSKPFAPAGKSDVFVARVDLPDRD